MTAAVRFQRRVALLLAVGVTAVTLACGGGGEAPDEAQALALATSETTGATPTEAPQATEAPPTEVPQATEAPPETTAAAIGGEDETYLRALCTAGSELEVALIAAIIRLDTEAADPDDPQALGEFLVDPLGAFLDTLRGVTPPADLAEYHAAALASYEMFLEVFASQVQGGGLNDDQTLLFLVDGMLAGDDDQPALSPETLARLDSAAAEIPECAGSPVEDSFLGQWLGQGTAAPSPSPMPPGAVAGADPVAEAYVRELCLAGSVFEATSTAALAGLDDGADPEGGDPAVFAAVYRDATRGLADDLALITPPDALAASHAAAIGRFEEMVSVLDAITGALDAGAEPPPGDSARFGELLGGGIAMPGLSAAEADGLSQAARHVPECSDSGFILGFLSGGP